MTYLIFFPPKIDFFLNEKKKIAIKSKSGIITLHRFKIEGKKNNFIIFINGEIQITEFNFISFRLSMKYENRNIKKKDTIFFL